METAINRMDPQPAPSSTHWFPSERLPDIRSVAQRLGLLNRPGLKLTLVITIDANVVVGELSWRLRKRRDPAARSSLRELVDSGLLRLVAPPWLDAEIKKHADEYASRWKVSRDLLLAELETIWEMIAKIDPGELLRASGAPVVRCPDPDDQAYVDLCLLLSTDGIFTKDGDFEGLGIHVLTPGSGGPDSTLRILARSQAELLGIEVSGCISIVVTGGTLMETFRAVGKLWSWIPGWAKLLGAVSLAAALRSPSMLEKLWAFAARVRTGFEQVAEMILPGLGQMARRHLSARNKHQGAISALGQLLPDGRAVDPLSLAYRELILEGTPLRAHELGRRLRNAGVPERVARTRSFAQRLGRDSRFRRVGSGRWEAVLAGVT